ncbi:MAG: hypothetical protein P8X47_03260, partial [Ignavibacteriaceae bacterium]
MNSAETYFKSLKVNLLDNRNQFLYVLIAFALFLIYILLIINTAWLGDDSYITYRTVDNFINGYGLRWNIAERVQSYTHPLWLFLLSAVNFFSHEMFLTPLIISIVISAIAVFLLAFKVSRSYENVLIVLLAVILSKTFIDYSTSGLENPLTHLLLVLFGLVYFLGKEERKKTFILSLLAALILVNRSDIILLVLPVYTYYLIKYKAYKNFGLILLGFLPFILWELFSLIYYGFPFPNTAYAKLNTGINRFDLIHQGFLYFYKSFLLDPIMFVIIFLAAGFSLVKRNQQYLVFIAGIFLYFLYTLWIGGDFMSGRFFVAPLVLSLIVLSRIEFKSVATVYVLVLIIISIGAFSLYSTLTKKIADIGEDGICDERLFYYRESNLMSTFRGSTKPIFIWVKYGEQAKAEGLTYTKFPNIGFYGYYAGRQCYILDELALCDPLLSKLPAIKPWRIGHFKRDIPEGYEETLQSGINKIKDKDLSEYYD